MSQLLYQYFLKKTNLDHVIAMGPEEDPYFEPIPENELHFYQKKGAKRKRKMPNFIPKKDLDILNSIKRKAYRLDLQLSMCGLRLGLSGIIGLLPWVGDVICLFLSLQILHAAQNIEGGLPASLQSRMMANIAFDFGIGLIPFLGDFCAILYKCNSRNFVLLEKHLVHKYGGAHAVTTDPIQHEAGLTGQEKAEAPVAAQKHAATVV
ncbi:uncharacterized protein RJT20DRAFT_43309 [Scheffersomyces xylosifermentans]|uniref:uncharacterized protein n=1 Tax=Scheffersomyces xylosifermentans TaxID=1304137 RepID=UPI00315CDC15